MHMAIRLLLYQTVSNQIPHCFTFALHLLGAFSMVKLSVLNCRATVMKKTIKEKAPVCQMYASAHPLKLARALSNNRLQV